MRYIFQKKDPLILVIKLVIGQLYHVSWAGSHGIVGRCISVKETAKTVRLVSPKTKIPFKNPVNWSDLRHTRKNQVRNPH